MHGHGGDVFAALVQRVDEADVAVTAKSEHVRNFFLHQIIDDHLTAVEGIRGGHAESSSVGDREAMMTHGSRHVDAILKGSDLLTDAKQSRVSPSAAFKGSDPSNSPI